MKTSLLLSCTLLCFVTSMAAPELSARHAAAPKLTMEAALPATQVQAVVTAYCPCSICCGKTAHGVTATGVSTADHPFGLAVPRQLLHSRITVPGYGTFEADDTGGAMNRDMAASIIHIDVRFPSHAEALQWGKQRLTITIEQKN